MLAGTLRGEAQTSAPEDVCPWLWREVRIDGVPGIVYGVSPGDLADNIRMSRRLGRLWDVDPVNPCDRRFGL